MLELSLKSGKVAFTWKLIRSWLNPAPIEAPPSAHDGAVLDLPLSIVAPIFLAQKQDASRRKQVALDTSIPDLFAGKDRHPSAASVVNAPAPQSASALVAEPTVAVASAPVSETVRSAAKPNDVVRFAAGHPGVDGCLVALHDGLLVAGKVPSPWNSETLAAFVPQIFGRVNQTMQELRLGQLKNLSFTVGGVPWFIVRLEETFFAAFGQPGTALPITKLETLATELDTKS